MSPTAHPPGHPEPAASGPPPEVLIAAEGLGRRHGAVVALTGCSFAIGRGQVVGFLGRNGAGKTTTLRILTGTLAPTEGRAWVAGCDVSRAPEFRHRLGYLAENAPADPEPSVISHLRFVARVRGIPRHRLASALDRVVEQCALGEVLNRPMGALSKGFRQRVGLAQAIVHDPDILILDEPTTGLDPTQVQHMRALVRALGADRTVLFSSHALAEVQAVADRVLVLERGRLVADDALATLSARLGGGAVRATVRVPGAADWAGARAAVEAALGDLATAEGVQLVVSPTLEPESFCFEIKCLSAQDRRAELAARLVGARLELLGLTREGADLEAVFRTLTEAGADDAGGQHGR